MEGSLVKEKLSQELLACRVAAELKPGQVVRLGAGLPAMVPSYVPTDRGVTFHAENGVVGYGPRPRQGRGDPDLVDAGGESISILPGGAIVDHADSFGMIRGGYVEVAVVEALQVSERGDLVDRTASFFHPGYRTGSLESLGFQDTMFDGQSKKLGGHAASVDVAAGAKYLIAMMEHTTPDGAPRIVKECSYPTAGLGCVNLIVTDVAAIQVTDEGLLLKEIGPGWRVEDVQAITGADLTQAPDLKEMGFFYSLGEIVNKVYPSAVEAVSDIPDGAVLMLDGFAGPGGMAQYLILALREQGAKNLTIISNTAGIANVASFGLPPGFRTVDHSLLVDSGQVGKAVASFPVSPSPSRPNSFELAYRRGEAELELVPQGTLAERIRAGGYGIAAFYTPTGAGTLIAEGKETRTLNGREYVLERGLRADFALLRAHVADRMGNLVYKGTSRNFNVVMAPAADITIVEVDEIVEAGGLDPDAIVTPGVFVQRIVRRPTNFWPYEPVG